MRLREACPECGSTQYKKQVHMHNGTQNHQCLVDSPDYLICQEQEGRGNRDPEGLRGP